MTKSNYIFENFSFTKKYRNELIEFLKHNANIEHGGYRLFDGTYTHLLQIPEELADFIIYLKKIEKTKGKFRNILEIGFGNGSTNTILNKFFQFEKIVVVDDFSASTSNTNLVANLRHKNLIILCGDSTSDWCKKNAKNLGPFDLIFIDGNHQEPFVQKDFENYGPLINKNGFIVLHDIASEEWLDVSKRWSIIKRNKKFHSKEFICRDYKIKFGIGLISKK